MQGRSKGMVGGQARNMGSHGSDGLAKSKNAPKSDPNHSLLEKHVVTDVYNALPPHTNGLTGSVVVRGFFAYSKYLSEKMVSKCQISNKKMSRLSEIFKLQIGTALVSRKPQIHFLYTKFPSNRDSV